MIAWCNRSIHTWHICCMCYEIICLCDELIHVDSTSVTACVWEEKISFSLHHTLYSLVAVVFPTVSRMSKVHTFESKSHNPYRTVLLTSARESPTDVSSAFHLEERPPLAKRKAQNILFLRLNAHLFYFSKVWLSIMRVAVLSSDSAPLSWSYQWCGIFMLCYTHTALRTHMWLINTTITTFLF